MAAYYLFSINIKFMAAILAGSHFEHFRYPNFSYSTHSAVN